MKKTDWTRNQLAAGGFGNTVLYRMVAENPKHDTLGVVKDKMLIIGRVYSAAVTRGAGEKNIKNEKFEDKLYDHIAKKIWRRRKVIDERIGRCNKMDRISSKNLKYIIETHTLINDIIVKAINSWRLPGARKVNDRTSFTSKYLHFHAPMAFFILDSMVQKELKNQGFKGERTLWPKGFRIKHRTKYGMHCIRMLKHADAKYHDNWTPRLIDGHLMGYISKT